MVGIVCALALTLVGSGTAFALYMNDINKRLVGGKSEDELRALADVLVPVTDYTEPFYLLLLGSDAREDEDEGGARTDTNILVRVDASTATVTLISIMRDTMINMGNYGTIKFNAAYAYEGTAGAVREASKLCGVNIAHYAEIEFEEFMTLVDALGGVEVDVPQRIADVEAGPVVLEPGVQTLDGVGALTLARSRKAFDDGDFSRTANQRLIIEAIVSKVLTMPLVDMIGAIEAATTSITTDMKLEEIISLARQFRTSGGTTIYSAVVPSALAMIDGISYVVADTEALKEMMRLVKAGKDPSGIVSTMVHPSMDPSTGDSSYYEEPLYGEPVYEPPPEEEDQPYEELPPVAGGEEPDPIGNEGDGTAAAP
jgi:LCP family protein required for cell wall assembly